MYIYIYICIQMYVHTSIYVYAYQSLMGASRVWHMRQMSPDSTSF